MTPADLQRRIDALSEEIRHYPAPIACCDLHLPALIEERAELMAKLQSRSAQGGCSPNAIWANDGGRGA